MKSGYEAIEPDAIDLQIIDALQEHGRIPLVKLAEQVGLSAPSVIERVKKLEDGGIITGYHASVDARSSARTSPPSSAFRSDIRALIDLFEQTVALMRRRARMPSRHRRAHGAAQS